MIQVRQLSPLIQPDATISDIIRSTAMVVKWLREAGNHTKADVQVALLQLYMRQQGFEDLPATAATYSEPTPIDVASPRRSVGDAASTAELAQCGATGHLASYRSILASLPTSGDQHTPRPGSSRAPHERDAGMSSAVSSWSLRDPDEGKQLSANYSEHHQRGEQPSESSLVFSPLGSAAINNSCGASTAELNWLSPVMHQQQKKTSSATPMSATAASESTRQEEAMRPPQYISPSSLALDTLDDDDDNFDDDEEVDSEMPRENLQTAANVTIPVLSPTNDQPGDGSLRRNAHPPLKRPDEGDQLTSTHQELEEDQRHFDQSDDLLLTAEDLGATVSEAHSQKRESRRSKSDVAMHQPRASVDGDTCEVEIDEIRKRARSPLLPHSAMEERTLSTATVPTEKRHQEASEDPMGVMVAKIHRTETAQGEDITRPKSHQWSATDEDNFQTTMAKGAKELRPASKSPPPPPSMFEGPKRPPSIPDGRSLSSSTTLPLAGLASSPRLQQSFTGVGSGLPSRAPLAAFGAASLSPVISPLTSSSMRVVGGVGNVSPAPRPVYGGDAPIHSSRVNLSSAFGEQAPLAATRKARVATPPPSAQLHKSMFDQPTKRLLDLPLQPASSSSAVGSAAPAAAAAAPPSTGSGKAQPKKYVAPSASLKAKPGGGSGGANTTMSSSITNKK